MPNVFLYRVSFRIRKILSVIVAYYVWVPDSSCVRLRYANRTYVPDQTKKMKIVKNNQFRNSYYCLSIYAGASPLRIRGHLSCNTSDAVCEMFFFIAFRSESAKFSVIVAYYVWVPDFSCVRLRYTNRTYVLEANPTCHAPLIIIYPVAPISAA